MVTQGDLPYLPMYDVFQILVIDVCKEEGNTPYKLADGTKYSPMYMVKRALTLFLQNKYAIDSRHKFALVILHDAPVWVSFTASVYSAESVYRIRMKFSFGLFYLDLSVYEWKRNVLLKSLCT